MRIDLSGAHLSGTPGNTTVDPDQSKLRSAAQQFEAILLQELLKPIQSSGRSLDSDTEDSDKSSDVMSGYGTEAIANAISKSGGLGIGKKVFQQVQSEHEHLSEKRGLKSSNGFIKQADTVK